MQRFARLGIGALLAIGVLCSGAPALAQLEPQAPSGSRIARKPGEAPIDETRQIMANFARCVVKKHPVEAVQFVLDPRKSWPDKTVRKLADSNCMTETAMLKDADVALSLPGDIMRYAIADALVTKEFPIFDRQLIESAKPLPRIVLDLNAFAPKPGKRYKPEDLQKLEKAKASEQLRLSFLKYGECVVRTDPAAAHSLLTTKPSSAEESKAFQQLMPGFGQCLERGTQFKSNRTILRGVIALNFYRLAHAPRVAIGSEAQE